MRRPGAAVRRAHRTDARRRRPLPAGDRDPDPEFDPHHVTLVCNDWGGAQLAIRPGCTDRVANLVLVSCKAFDNYPPGAGQLPCINAAPPGGTFVTAQLLRQCRIRHLPVTSDALSKRRVPDDLSRVGSIRCATTPSRTLIPIDQPKALIDHLHTFLATNERRQ